jgi:hypothetical protein
MDKPEEGRSLLTRYKLGRSLRGMDMDELVRESKEEESVRRLAEMLEETRAAFADVPEEEFNREVDKALAEVRREMAAEREAAEPRRRASS